MNVRPISFLGAPASQAYRKNKNNSQPTSISQQRQEQLKSLQTNGNGSNQAQLSPQQMRDIQMNAMMGGILKIDQPGYNKMWIPTAAIAAIMPGKNPNWTEIHMKPNAGIEPLTIKQPVDKVSSPYRTAILKGSGVILGNRLDVEEFPILDDCYVKPVYRDDEGQIIKKSETTDEESLKAENNVENKPEEVKKETLLDKMQKEIENIYGSDEEEAPLLELSEDELVPVTKDKDGNYRDKDGNIRIYRK